MMCGCRMTVEFLKRLEGSVSTAFDYKTIRIPTRDQIRESYKETQRRGGRDQEKEPEKLIETTKE